jgi:hypothetical protein
VQRGSVSVQPGSVSVQRGSVGAAWLSRVQRGSVRPEFKSPLGTPGRFFLLNKEAMKKTERGLGECMDMN